MSRRLKYYFNSSGLARLIHILGLVVIGLGWSASHNVALADDPAVSVVAPSNEIGDMGAALGNVLEMNGLNDVAWTQPDASNRTVKYTLQAATDPGVPAGGSGFVLKGVTPKGSDLVTAFYTDSAVSIPSQTYRYLFYRLYIAPHQPSEAGIQRTNARLLYSSEWGSNWLQEAFPYRRYSRPQRLECPAPTTAYGGWCTFFVDLGRTDLVGSGSPNPWVWGQPGAKVESFGLWPHENWCDNNCAPSGDSPDYFYLDHVYITGEIVAKASTSYIYPVKWNVSDPDGGQVVSNLYYQQQDEVQLPTQSPACNAANLATAWQPIPGGTNTISGLAEQPHRVFLPFISGSRLNTFGSGVTGSFNQSFDWNLADNTIYPKNKVHYICIVVEDDDGHKAYQVSTAPVIKAPPETSFN